jgi:hypothetical protein
MLSIEEITTALAEIDQVRQRVTKFLIAALPTMGPDAFKLALAVSAMVAAGGANPAAVMAGLDDLNQLNADFTAAIASVKAQETVAA